MQVNGPWGLVGDFPFPTNSLKCPGCGGGYLRGSSWKFQREASGDTCNVAFRCLECALWFAFDVPIESELYNKARAHGRTMWRWQDVMTTLGLENKPLFPNLTPDEVLEVVKEHWDWNSTDFPTPRWEVVCPSCRGTRIQPQFWQFSRYTSHNGANPYRCNVSMKCTCCSYVMMFGVFIPQEVYNRHARFGAQTYHWREVKKLMEQGQGGRAHAEL